MNTKRYYLDDLFPRGPIAQVPYLYGPEHSERLNEIVRKGQRGMTADGRVYYELAEGGTTP